LLLVCSVCSEAVVNLTKRTVESAAWHGREGTADYRWDDDLPAFGIRVYPSGRKSFIVSYRAQGRQHFHTLGQFGPMTVHEAKTCALGVLAAVRRGDDPAGDRSSYRKAPTMADLFERFMREHARPRKKATSVVTDERIWQLHVLPQVGKRKIADLERADVSRLHAEMAETPYQANRLLAVLSKAFNLAEVWGWRIDGSNPCRHVQRFREEKRERFLSGEELAGLSEVLTEAEQARLESPFAVAAIRLLILTGCRVGEIVKLTWSEVDFERRCLRLADSKTGKKTVYLNTAALQLLAELDRDPENPHVIQGNVAGNHLIGLTRIWFRIRRRAGLEEVRLHDLRHTFASVGAGMGLSLPIIGKLLGHTQAVTTQRYAHLASDPMHDAAERIGASLGASLAGKPRAKVVQLRSA
jgi:integrase